MEDNNLNQDNQMGTTPTVSPSVEAPVQPAAPAPVAPPVAPDSAVPATPVVEAPMPAVPPAVEGSIPVPPNAQYQVPPVQNNMGVAQPTTNASQKSKAPLVVFGLVAVVAIVLIITLFIENKDGGTTGTNSLINENTKTIIVYYSKEGENYGKNLDMENKRVLDEGNTAVMAKRIASFINADLYELEPVVPYPEDLSELYGATKKELISDTYPEIKTPVKNLDSYDVVFIGYPIWHAAYPQIIKTFVRDNKSVLENKIIVPFNTHAGSGSAGTYKKLFDLIGTPSDKGLNGLAINGTEVKTSDDNIKDWLIKLGYTTK